MSAILDCVVALARASDRAQAAAALGKALGGEGIVIFLRDEHVGMHLPAPGFPQTLPNGKVWRALVRDAVIHGDRGVEALTPPGGGPAVPAFGFSCGPDVVAVLLGCRSGSDDVEAVRHLLPLLERALAWERDASQAFARERMARQETAHTGALAAALDQVRAHLQGALADAEKSRVELEHANELLRDQALEMEQQAEELQVQAEELQQVNVDLAAASSFAENANLAKSEFLATMSHELRTPLNAISGHVQLIEMGIYGPVSQRQREALDRINRSQRHLLGLINDVLNFSRIEAGKVEYQISDIVLADVLADVAPMIEPQFLAKTLTYDVMAADRRIIVKADRDKLQQVVLNLLSNAVKFTQASGNVSVSYAVNEAAGTVDLHVRDTGMGIPQEKLGAIFEPFVQVNSGHNRQSEGTGLGLAISRDFARGMGGELTVQSALGTGSTFTLRIPAAIRT